MREQVGRMTDVNEDIDLDNDLVLLSAETKLLGEGLWSGKLCIVQPEQEQGQGGGMITRQLSVHVRWIIHTKMS